MLFFNTLSMKTEHFSQFLKPNLTIQEATELEYVPLFYLVFKYLEAEISSIFCCLY